MSDPAPGPRPPRPRPSTRATTVKLTLVSVAAAAALTGGLAAQMASGHDPALGSGTKAATAGAQPAQTTAGPQTTDAPAPTSVVTRAS